MFGRCSVRENRTSPGADCLGSAIAGGRHAGRPVPSSAAKRCRLGPVVACPFLRPFRASSWQRLLSALTLGRSCLTTRAYPAQALRTCTAGACPPSGETRPHTHTLDPATYTHAWPGHTHTCLARPHTHTRSARRQPARRSTARPPQVPCCRPDARLSPCRRHACRPLRPSLDSALSRSPGSPVRGCGHVAVTVTAVT